MPTIGRVAAAIAAVLSICLLGVGVAIDHPLLQWLCGGIAGCCITAAIAGSLEANRQVIGYVERLPWDHVDLGGR